MSVDFSKIKTYSLYDRSSLSNVKDFAAPFSGDLGALLASIPNIYSGSDFKAIISHLKAAKAAKRKIIWGIGAHVIKFGLNPLLIQLMENGFITSIAVNGASAIHDVEFALAGKSSEDVGESLHEGEFGVAKETAEFINKAAKIAADANVGFGAGLKRLLEETKPKYAKYSILCAAARLNIPVTVHVALGTDIVHMHPSMSGEATGKATYDDFKLFCNEVSEISGGAYINAGSNVLLPEIFLKAIAISQNQAVSAGQKNADTIDEISKFHQGKKLKDFITVVLDYNYQYRPLRNVVERPTKGIGKGYYLIGRHELMIPLLAAALLSK